MHAQGPRIVVVITHVGTQTPGETRRGGIDPADYVIINSYLNLYFRPRAYARHRVFSNGEIVSKF